MRQYNNLSQQDLADRSGVKQPMIARFERGINTPNMSTCAPFLAAATACAWVAGKPTASMITS